MCETNKSHKTKIKSNRNVFTCGLDGRASGPRTAGGLAGDWRGTGLNIVCRIQFVLMKHFAIDEHLLNTNVYMAVWP